MLGTELERVTRPLFAQRCDQASSEPFYPILLNPLYCRVHSAVHRCSELVDLSTIPYLNILVLYLYLRPPSLDLLSPNSSIIDAGFQEQLVHVRSM